jgi:branched-chain amino acid aminotransferase
MAFMNIFCIDGEFVPENQAVLSVNDIGLLRGYGIFDFMRTYNRRPFYLEEHVARLANSARLTGLAMPWSQGQIVEMALKTLERNPELSDANIRLVITGGISADSITPENKTSLLIMVTDLHRCPPEWYQDGVVIITTHDERYMPRAKSTNYLPGILALARARQQGAIESIYIDRYGRLLEGTTSNLFAFIGDKLVTPGTAILPGITRKVVLELAEKEFEIEIRDIFRDEVRLMDEVFLSSSNKEVVPVVRMDELIFSGGKPGQRTRRLMQRFADYTHQYGQKGK